MAQQERVAKYNSTPAAGDSTDDEDEVVIVPFSPSLRLEPSEDEEEVQDTSEEEEDDNWSPPAAKVSLQQTIPASFGARR